MADISIIIPIYNAEKYLKKCIDSLVEQTKKELEFILINDGSTDDTEKIIKSYKDKRIKYFKNKNQGIGKTRNFGIEKATGKYIMFLDSDDYLEPDSCEVLYNTAEKEKSDLVICDFYKVYENNKIEEIKLPKFKPTTLKKSPNLLLDINLAPWNKLYKSDLIKSNKLTFVENLKYEDAPFVSQALDKATKITKVDKCLNYYVIHGNSETTVRDKRVFDILKIIDIIRTYFKNKQYMKDIVDKLTVRIITNYNIQQRNQQDKKVGMEFIEESFKYLKNEVPDYKSNKYYENRSFLKRTMEKSKFLSKTYCSLYNAKKKQNFDIRRILIIALYSIMTVIFSYTLFNVIFKNNNLTNIKPIELIISTILYIILINIFSKKLSKPKNKFLIIALIILIIVQLIFAYMFAVRPAWDFGAIYESSIKHINGELLINENTYFYRYSNNLPYVIILTTIYSIPNLLGLNSYTIYGLIGILINIFCIDLSIIFIYKILKLYFEEKTIKLFCILTLICTPFITYTPIFYTDTISLPFVAGGIYYLLKMINNNKNKILNITISALLLGIGCCLKFTIIIVLIAFIIAYMLFINNQEKIFNKIKVIALLITIFFVPTLLVITYKTIAFDQEKIKSESFPITHWIMMGLTGNGGYNQPDVDYTGSYKTKDEKQDANIKVINDRIKQLIKDKKVLKFYTNKILYTWGDGTFYATAKLRVTPLKEIEVKEYILSTGNKSHLFTIFAQTELIIIILFIIIGMIFSKYLNKKQQSLQLFLNITIFGIFIFFLIWEARARYLVNILPVLLIACYLGITAIMNYIKYKKVEE